MRSWKLLSRKRGDMRSLKATRHHLGKHDHHPESYIASKKRKKKKVLLIVSFSYITLINILLRAIVDAGARYCEPRISLYLYFFYTCVSSTYVAFLLLSWLLHMRYAHCSLTKSRQQYCGTAWVAFFNNHPMQYPIRMNDMHNSRCIYQESKCDY